MKTNLLKLVLAAAFILIPQSGRAMNVDEVKNPQVTSASFVEDAGGVLGPEYASLIDGICKNLEGKTSAELAVVTIDNLGGTTVEDFAVKLFERFGIGKKGKDNGLLILFVRDDRKVRIEVGYGLEGVINDAKAGRLLDTYAIPKFKNGEYGRGLYDLTKAAAEEIAKSSGVSLGVADPGVWPVQAAVEIPQEYQKETPPVGNVSWAVSIYAIVILGIAFIMLAVKFIRVHINKAIAAKKRVMGKGMAIPVIALFIGAIIMFFIGTGAEKFVIPLIGYLATALIAVASQKIIELHLERHIKGYRLSCSKCREKMDIVDDITDNKFLDAEEVAEERAGGMDYEFWKCPKCDMMERFNVKLPRADNCPKCKRRTLGTTKTVLVSATTSSAGREKIEYKCKNPKCDYVNEKIRTIPKVSSSSSGSSSFGSSGGSSFGGGSSGGGGSSRGW